jgi:hypothetical protein
MKSSAYKSDLTCPDGILIQPSTISKAGKGVFATKRFEKNTFFGPYLGTRHSNFKTAQESGYSWSIADKNGKVRETKLYPSERSITTLLDDLYYRWM